MQSITTQPAGDQKLKVVGPEYLVPLIQRSVRTIKEDSRRKPWSLPPRLAIPGSTRLLWLESDVLDWIRSCSTAKPEEIKRKPGRPVNPDYLRSIQKQLTTNR